MAGLPDPFLDDGMRGFITKFAIKNFWRVPPHYDLDDLIADGYLCYYKIRRHPNYKSITDKPDPTPDDVRQVMAMVKTAFTRHVHTLCANGHALVHPETSFSQVAPPGRDFESALDETTAAEGGMHEVLPDLVAAPAEVVQLFQLLLRDTQLAVRFLRDAAGQRETTAQHRARVVSASGAMLRFQRTQVGRRSVRETTNEFYCRLLGLPASVDVRGMVRAYLS